MSSIQSILSPLALIAGGILACPATAQPQPAVAPTQGELKRRFTEAAEKDSAPTEQHKALAAFVGEFDQASEIRMGPGEPLKARSVARGRWIMGGRFVQVDSAAAPDEELKGERTLVYGYDPSAKVYTLYNFETGSLACTVARGTYDPNSKTFTFEGERPLGKEKMPFRWVFRVQDKGAIDMKILVKPDGDKFVEVAAVRHTPKGK